MSARKIKVGKVINKDGLVIKDSVDIEHSPVVAEIGYGRRIEYTSTRSKNVILVKVSNKVYGYAEKADVK